MRMGLRAFTRWQEKEADKYTVVRGYGEACRDALIRSHAKSLDLLFTSKFDEILNVDHPHLRERLELVEGEIKRNSVQSYWLAELAALKLEVPKREGAAD